MEFKLSSTKIIVNGTAEKIRIIKEEESEPEPEPEPFTIIVPNLEADSYNLILTVLLWDL